MTLIETYVGNRSPSITDQITVNGAGFPLTTSSVAFKMRPEGSSTLKTNAAATIVNAPTGQVQYNWASTDVDTLGRYMAWWSVTLPSGLVQDSPEFPVLVKGHDGTTSQITIDSIRDHVETGITDEALGVLLDDAVQQVESRFGTDASMTVRVESNGRYIRLQRPALTITSISEFNDERYALYTLVGVDWELQHDGRLIRRLTGNTTFYADREWAPVVDVTYVPRSEQAIRDRVVVDLVRLATQYNALQGETIGGSRAGHVSSSLDYLKERERILMAVPNNRGFRFA